jgi:hypothetical protein
MFYCDWKAINEISRIDLSSYRAFVPAEMIRQSFYILGGLVKKDYNIPNLLSNL